MIKLWGQKTLQTKPSAFDRVNVRRLLLCKCGQPASTFLHICPYKAEINGDVETVCNCCDKCRQLCAEEV